MSASATNDMDVDKALKDLKKKKHNKYCFDCQSQGPRYVNLTIGSFVCEECGGILRSFNHRLLGLGLGTFHEKDIEQIVGNKTAAKTWMALWDDPLPTLNGEDAKKKHLKEKYIDKKWYSSEGKPDKKTRRSSSKTDTSKSVGKPRSQQQEDVFGGNEPFEEQDEWVTDFDGATQSTQQPTRKVSQPPKPSGKGLSRPPSLSKPSSAKQSNGNKAGQSTGVDPFGGDGQNATEIGDLFGEPSGAVQKQSASKNHDPFGEPSGGQHNVATSNEQSSGWDVDFMEGSNDPFGDTSDTHEDWTSFEEPAMAPQQQQTAFSPPNEQNTAQNNAVNEIGFNQSSTQQQGQGSENKQQDPFSAFDELVQEMPVMQEQGGQVAGDSSHSQQPHFPPTSGPPNVPGMNMQGMAPGMAYPQQQQHPNQPNGYPYPPQQQYYPPQTNGYPYPPQQQFPGYSQQQIQGMPPRGAPGYAPQHPAYAMGAPPRGYPQQLSPQFSSPMMQSQGMPTHSPQQVPTHSTQQMPYGYMPQANTPYYNSQGSSGLPTQQLYGTPQRNPEGKQGQYQSPGDPFFEAGARARNYGPHSPPPTTSQLVAQEYAPPEQQQSSPDPFANLTDDLDIGLPSGKSTGKHQPRNHQQPSHTPPQYSFQTSTTTQNNGGSDNQVAQAAADDDDDDDDPFKMF